MRVRLYEVGRASYGVLFIDEFPTFLGLDEDGRIHSEDRQLDSVCQLDDVGGQLYLRAPEAVELEVNNAPLEEGPLMPGDRLRWRGHDYLVSYEQTQICNPPPPKFRIQN